MAKTMMKGVAPHRHAVKLYPEWLTREGTICRKHRYSGDYAVKWDDRVSIEAWPAKALEKINGPSSKSNGS